MFNKVITLCNIITLLVSPFSINNPSVSVSNISNFVADQVTNYKDLTFNYSSGSISGTQTVSAHNLQLTASGTYLRCVTFASNGNCQYYQLSSTPASASNVFIDEKQHTISVSETETYSNVRYNWIQQDVLDFAFTDGKTHTGYFTLAPSSSYYGFQTDNDNVAIIGSTVYFFNTGGFEIIHEIPHQNSSTLSNSTYSYTASNMILLDSQASINTTFSPDSSSYLAYLYWKQYSLNEIVSVYNTLVPGLKPDTAFPNITSYDSSKVFAYNPEQTDPYYISFYATASQSYQPNIYSWKGYSYKITRVTYAPLSPNNFWALYTYKIVPTAENGNPEEDRICIAWQSWANAVSLRVLPIYVGYQKSITDDLQRQMGINLSIDYTRTNDSTTDALNDAISNENQVASSFESSFDSAQNNIDTSNPILGISNFANSANWVRVQFERFTTNNAFGTLLGFSLLLGLALAIIGRVL